MQHGLVYERPATEERRETAADRDERSDAGAARPSGPAAAAVLAAGVAAFALGLLSVLAAASTTVTDALTLSERVGETSGLTVFTAAAFLATWAGLALAWRRADPPLLRVAAAAGVLVALGLLGTFPPFFNAFGG
jgi:hypothetical protein